ncbi:MAG: DUF2690 domain-containing protein, partial [Actinobacteria bacterium]|nr:DUF2690 domain-containing protein [Actinomycetota bacterium]
WLARRDLLARGSSDALAEGSVDGGAEAAGVDEPDPQSRPGAAEPAKGSRMSTKATVLLVAAAFLLGIVAAGGTSYFVTAGLMEQARAQAAEDARKEILASPVSEHAQINVHNGVDPALTPCVNDAKVAASQPRTNNTLLEIVWSNKCYAGWARVTRYDEKISGNSITVSIYPETAATGPDRQTATEPNVQGAYTTLVVRPTPQTRLCAVGAITLKGESIDLGEPLCI